MSDLYQDNHQIRIPRNLKELLNQDQGLTGSVQANLNEFKPWIKKSNVPFFPEYTDHGIKHIEDVLCTIEWLIPEESWNILTPEDAAVLIIATLLHDSALHLTEHGFVDLIENSNGLPKSQLKEYFSDESWSELWQEYKSESRRFDQKKLNKLFGDTKPVSPPELDPLEFTKRDRLLIGEFLRRHHHRLAHEISLIGVMGKDDLKLSQLSDEILDIIGLIARSHGMPIRDTLDYIEEFYHLRDYNGVHIVYLMTLIRIADYLQIQSERAHNNGLDIKIASPVSRREHDLHNSVRNITVSHPDPEAIYIDAIPRKVGVFLRLKDWIEGIQFELDRSWAILGEVYSLYSNINLDSLNLKLRRVRSNIENLDEFSSKVNYLPKKISFDVASAELLELLIQPLYGNKPEIGVRELLQNAVDAVRERDKYIRQQNFSLNDIKNVDYDVLIEIEEAKSDNFWLTISDTGIGMTPDTVENYFLKAGATFRRSNLWKKRFEDNGKSEVLRSGRFGIGVLAAFLIGDEIFVSTKHISQKKYGVTFKAQLNEDNIQLEKRKMKVGTKIRIKINQKLFNYLTSYDETRYFSKPRLLIDWFCLKYPEVQIKLTDSFEEQRFKIPSPKSSLDKFWNRIKSKYYQDLQWSYYDESPDIVCNGIVVQEGRRTRYQRSNLHEISRNIGFDFPSISVFDPDGYFPLSLSRNELIGELSFRKDLARNITKDFIAFLLVNGPTKAEGKGLSFLMNSYPYTSYGNNTEGRKIPQYPGVKRENPFVFSKEGFTCLDPYIFKQFAVNSLGFIQVNRGRERDEKCLNKIISCTENNLLLRIIKNPSLKDLLYGNKFIGEGFNVKGKKIYFSKFTADKKNKPYNLKKSIRNRIEEQKRTEKSVLWQIGYCPNQFNFNGLAIEEKTDGFSPFKISEWFLDLEEEENLLGEVWKKYIGQLIIPFDLQERREKLSNAYKELDTYIQKHKKIKRE